MYETPWHERLVHFENARAYDQLREFDHLTYLVTDSNSGLTEKKLETYLDETSVENVLLRIEEKIWEYHLAALKTAEAKSGRTLLLERAFQAGQEFARQDYSPFQKFEDAFQKLRQSRVLWRSSEKLIVPVRNLEPQIIFEVFFKQTRLDNPYLAVYLEWIRGFIFAQISKPSLKFQINHFTEHSRIEVSFDP